MKPEPQKAQNQSPSPELKTKAQATSTVRRASARTPPFPGQTPTAATACCLSDTAGTALPGPPGSCGAWGPSPPARSRCDPPPPAPAVRGGGMGGCRLGGWAVGHRMREGQPVVALDDFDSYPQVSLPEATRVRGGEWAGGGSRESLVLVPGIKSVDRDGARLTLPSGAASPTNRMSRVPKSSAGRLEADAGLSTTAPPSPSTMTNTPLEP